MNSFSTQVQCEELTDTRPTSADWAEYCEWLDSQNESDDYDDDGAVDYEGNGEDEWGTYDDDEE